MLILPLLTTPGVFNFLLATLQSPPTDNAVANTLELFMFGTLKHYQHYHHQCIEFTPELSHKLLLLTLISITNEQDGLTVPLAQLQAEYGIPTTIELDRAVIELVDNKWGELRIAGDALVVGETKVIRDSYDSDVYTLRMMNVDDIPRRLVAVAKDRLQMWFDSRVAPVKSEFSKELKKRTKREYV